jgi:hypothetical protein
VERLIEGLIDQSNFMSTAGPGDDNSTSLSLPAKINLQEIFI